MTWKINLSEWRVHEYVTWQTAIKQVDVITINEYLARAIESWDFTDDPRVEEHYNWLTLDQWGECIAHVNLEILSVMRKRIEEITKDKP